MTKKKKLETEKVRFLDLPQGAIAITAFPMSLETFYSAEDEGVDHIISLVSPKEGAEWVGKVAEIMDISWANHPFQYSADNMDVQYMPIVRRAVQDVADRLLNNERIWIHCIEGIHRSGLVTLGALLSTGMSILDAALAIYVLRRKSYWALTMDTVVIAHEAIGRTINWEAINRDGRIDTSK